MHLSYFIRGICSIISATIIHFLIGSYHTWKHLLPYYISYLYHTGNTNVLIKHSVMYIPYFRLIYTFFLMIGVIATSKIGIYIPCIVSLSLLIISHCVLLLSTSFTYVVIAFAMFAIGSGLVYTSVIINAWCYFPTAKGTILGLILSGFGCSGLITTIVLNRTVNPLKKEVNEVNGYYDKDIAIQSLVYIKYVLMFIIVGSVLSLMLINPWRKQFEVEEKEEDVVYNTNHYDPPRSHETYNELVNQYNCNDNGNECIRTTTTTTTEYVKCNENIMLCLRSKPLYQLMSVYFLSSLFNSLHINQNWKFFAKGSPSTSNVISYSIYLFNLGNCVLRTCCGMLLDRFNFRETYLIVLFIQIATYSLFYFISEIPCLFALFNFITGVMNSFSTIVIPFSFYKVFGSKNGGILFGLSQFVSAIGNFWTPFVIDELGKDNLCYLILFLSSSFAKMLSAIVLCFIEEKRFDYGKRMKQTKKKKIRNSNKSDYSNI